MRVKSSTFIFVITVLVLSACANGEWVKPGSKTADFNKDNYECEKEAVRYLPNTNSVECDVDSFAAGSISSGKGKCRTRDHNQYDRHNLVTSCMKAKGWVWREKPESTKGQ
jgi:hypothetical protein